jgi:hypothetical protein
VSVETRKVPTSRDIDRLVDRHGRKVDSAVIHLICPFKAFRNVMRNQILEG